MEGCFSSLYIGILAATITPFAGVMDFIFSVSVPFTSGSSLQLFLWYTLIAPGTFQFPLHRDPRCNFYRRSYLNNVHYRFSSLYIGILAATGQQLQVLLLQ